MPKAQRFKKSALKMVGRIWFSIIGLVASTCLSKASLRSANYRKPNSGTLKGPTFAGSFFASFLWTSKEMKARPGEGQSNSEHQLKLVASRLKLIVSAIFKQATRELYRLPF